MRCFLKLSSGFALSALLLVAPAVAQVPVSGLVTTAEDQPLAGVTVSSGTSSHPEATTTGADGRFQLANSTNVLHAQLDGYQPLTLLIHPPARGLRLQLQPITLAPLAGAILVPPCTQLPRKDRNAVRLGTPDAGLQFTVPRKGWSLHDLGQGDLHEYILAPKHSRAQLILWIGGTAVPLTPEDHYFLESSSYAQRAILVDSGSSTSPLDSIGIDSFGTYPDGGRWRHLATIASGATYDHATPADAADFDAIIASLCVAIPVS
jgi:hypothetical protein